MVEVANLPLLARAAELAVEPRELRAIHERAVEREEAHVAAHVGVVALAIHVVGRVGDLLGAVVVPSRGLELDAPGQQCRVGLLEFLDVVVRLLAAVHVVAEHDDEIEREGLTQLRHLLRDFVLGPFSRTVVAHRQELQGTWDVWQGRLRAQRPRRRQRQSGRDTETASAAVG